MWERWVEKWRVGKGNGRDNDDKARRRFRRMEEDVFYGLLICQ